MLIFRKVLPEVADEFTSNEVAVTLARIGYGILFTDFRPVPHSVSWRRARLAIKFTEEGDLDAARKLVLGHLRFVAYLARSYKGYGLPYEDLVQEGNVD